MNRDDVELIEKQAAFSGYFRIDRLRLRIPLYEGGMSREVVREVLERGRVAAVLLVDPDRDSVVLIEQFRPGPYAAGEQPWLIEAVAGVIEGAESAEELARREAIEEADCEITDLFPVMRFFTSPGASTESGLSLGDKLMLIPGHCDPTVNLYDWYVCVRDGRVQALWPIVARGAVL